MHAMRVRRTTGLWAITELSLNDHGSLGSHGEAKASTVTMLPALRSGQALGSERSMG